LHNVKVIKITFSLHLCNYKWRGAGSLPGRRNEDDDEGVVAGCSLLLFYSFLSGRPLTILSLLLFSGSPLTLCFSLSSFSSLSIFVFVSCFWCFYCSSSVSCFSSVYVLSFSVLACLSLCMRLLTCSPSRPSVQGVGATGDEASWCSCVGWPMLLSVSVSFAFSVFPWFFCVLRWVTPPVFIFSGLCFRPPLSPASPRSFVSSLLLFFFLEMKEQRWWWCRFSLHPFSLRPFSGFYKAREGLVSLPPKMAGIVEARDRGLQKRHRGYSGRDLLEFPLAMICQIFPCWTGLRQTDDEQLDPKRHRLAWKMTNYSLVPDCLKCINWIP